MVSFEIFVKSMPPSVSSFCFAFKIPDDVAVTTLYLDLTILFALLLFLFLHRKEDLGVFFKRKLKNQDF